ncbi:MAG: S46 family peptidase [Bacteroidales bacterium]
MKNKILLSLLALGSICSSASADEGMWLLPQIKQNAQKMKELGLKLDAADIYSPDTTSLKDAIVIFGGGCTGEIISPNGLLLTNHHCGYDAIQQHSTVEKDYLKDGFWAMSYKEEIPTPGLKVTFIEKIADVTDAVKKELAKDTDPNSMNYLSPSYLNNLAKQMVANGEAQDIPFTSVEIKPFYNGNKYYMYYTKVYNDVRMVGAPPSSIGKFGFDTDNWMWPRHTGDFSLFRVYADKNGNPAEYSADNEPLKPKKFLNISLGGIKENDYAMIMGFPGSTSRYMTSWEVAERVKDNDMRIKVRGARQDVLLKEMLADPKVNIQYASKYARSSNYWKNSIGMNKGIQKLKVIERKEAEQAAFKQWALQNGFPQYAASVDSLQNIIEGRAELRYQMNALSEAILGGIEFSRNPGYPTALMDAVSKKAETDALKQAYQQFANKDYNPEVDRKVAKDMLKLYKEMIPAAQRPDIFTWIDTKYKGNIDAFVDDAFTRSIYANEANFNKFIAKPSAKVLENDPMVKFSTSVRNKAAELSAALKATNNSFNNARQIFMEGYLTQNKDKATYPDANFTIRMTYGNIKPYEPADGAFYNYYTTLKGVMEKEDPNNFEFIVPNKLKELYESKDYGRYAMEDGRMPVAFLSTNDITGGNSGSPVLNDKGELIGTAFDGNWEAMSGDLVFEPELQRTISVDIRYTLFVIEKYAGCKRLIDEMVIVE